MNTWHFQPFQAKQEFTIASGAQDCSLSIINIYKLASIVVYKVLMSMLRKIRICSCFYTYKMATAVLVAGLFLCCALSHSHPKFTVSAEK